VIVPTRGAASLLRNVLDDEALDGRGALVAPDMVTRDEWLPALAARLPDPPVLLGATAREVLLAAACRHAIDSGSAPPFRLRPGLVAQILAFYDTLRRNLKAVETFERLAVEALEPNAAIDRGAERLLRQTRFLVAAFREFDRRVAAAGALDEHGLRDRLLATPLRRPIRHLVVAHRDAIATASGLWPSDYDLMTRLPHLERIDVVATEETLAGGLLERLHGLLPGVEDVREERPAIVEGPLLVLPPASGRGPDLPPALGLSRDRETEVRGFARWVKAMARESGAPPLDRIALVVRRPLPYVYLAREVLRSGGVPCQMFDTLPLAAEPFAALLDLVLSFVTTGPTRASIAGLLRSPHFAFRQQVVPPPDPSRPVDDGGEGRLIGRTDANVLDRALAEAGYGGSVAELDRLAGRWRAVPAHQGAAATAAAVLGLARELAPLTDASSPHMQLEVLRTFLTVHGSRIDDDDPLGPRLLRARSAVATGLALLAEAYAAHDEAPMATTDLAAVIGHWIERRTFAPRTGDSGVHVVDAETARFGAFEAAQVAGLVEGDWPHRGERNILYSPGILRQLGWPADADRVAGERALFRDLLRVPAGRLRLSAFLLEDDALVSPASFVDDAKLPGLREIDEPDLSARIFEDEALTVGPPRPEVLGPPAADWARERVRRQGEVERQPGRRYSRVRWSPGPRGFAVSAIERYQDCPFKFFAAQVLRLDEAPEDQAALTPRTRGRFLHEVFERVFTAWDAQEGGAITPDRADEARARFAEVAEAALADLAPDDATIERIRLFGSSASAGAIDVLLSVEGALEPVASRLLEHRLSGEFTLGASDGRRVALHGVADRVDLLAGHRLRVFDYKTGAVAPDARRALQVAVYALSAAEELSRRDGHPWAVDQAAYLAPAAGRPVVPVVTSGSGDAGETLAGARERTFALIDAIHRGEFPPRPFDTAICASCSYASVCRKEYVGDR